MYRERARAAILGGFVADAATMPLHWIYDQTVTGLNLDQDIIIAPKGSGSINTNKLHRAIGNK